MKIEGEVNAISFNLLRHARWLLPLSLFFVSFFIYFLSIDLYSANFFEHNFIFDTDIKRVVMALTTPGFVHDIEAHRHPLFELFLKPPASYLNELILDPRRASLAVTSAIGALGVSMAYVIFFNASQSHIDSLLFTVVIGSASSVWLFFSVPETFAINCTAIISAFFLQSLNSANSRMLQTSFSYAVFTVAAAGITVTNAAYAVLGYGNLCRKWNIPAHKIFIIVVVFCLCVMQAMEFLSWIQTLIYPNSWTFTGLASFFDQLLSLDRLYISRMNVLSFRGIFEVFRTSFLDNIVAPGVEPKSFISFSRSWFNLTFTHRLSAIYAITVSCFLGFGLAFLYALVSKRAYIDVEVQLAFAFIVVACGIALVFRSLGVPLIFAVHVVFPLVYLGLRGYILLEWRHKRTLMAVFIALLVLNNAAFISDVNLHLREANGLGVEYPAD